MAAAAPKVVRTEAKVVGKFAGERYASKPADGPVVVTGASGYIAGVLIEKLLARGYTVRGTVRSSGSAKRVREAFNSDKLKVIEGVDLTADDNKVFREAFDGCSVVYHTASPFQPVVEDPHRDLLVPALKGTKNVVSAALATKSVRKIVLTSSVAAVRSATYHHGEDYVYSEKDFNDTATLENSAYPYSKIMAELAAWSLVQNQSRVQLLTINPSFVLGAPAFAVPTSTSVKAIVAIMGGKHKKDGGTPNAGFPSVDVNTVALAHVLAAENPKAHGRYIVSSRTPNKFPRITEILREAFPGADYADGVKEGGEKPKTMIVDASKAERELGVRYPPLEATVVSMAKALMDQGLIAKF